MSVIVHHETSMTYKVKKSRYFQTNCLDPQMFR